MALEPLVALPERTVGPGRWRLVVGTVIVFLALTAGSGLVDLLWPLPPPELTGNEAEARAGRRAAAQLADGSLARWIEEEHRTRSRVRDAVLAPYALTLYQGLREVRGDLVVGPGGWLFLRIRAVPEPLSDAALVARAVERIEALQWHMGRLGSRLVPIPVPRKAAVARDFLPPGINPRSHLDRALADALRQRGIDFVDLMPLFERGRRVGRIPYFRADSHWTKEAAVRSAEVAARQSGLWVPPGQRRTTLVERPVPPRFDLLGYLGIRPTGRTLRRLTAERVTETAVKLDGELLLRRRDLSSDLDTVLVGTSFSALSWLAPLLEHYTQRPILDASKAGRFPLHNLRQVLTTRRDTGLPPPSTVFLELPNHLFFEDALVVRLTPQEAVPHPWSPPE